MAEIVLSNVQKFFGAVQVIRDLNLTIADREFVVLLGPSGCGKTTTLRAIAGLEDISSGEIRIDGKPVQDLEASERDIAFVFQLYALYPHLTVFENIAFPLRAAGEGKADVDRQVRVVASALDITHLLQKRPSALSGGDMQRVAIGRALVRRPKAILMDEPIGALDAKLREDMRSELKRLHIENKATSVYVTHDQVEAMSLADRIVVMSEGVLQQVGTPIEVYQNPANEHRRREGRDRGRRGASPGRRCRRGLRHARRSSGPHRGQRTGRRGNLARHPSGRRRRGAPADGRNRAARSAYH